MDFGKKVKEARLKSFMSQQEFANALGVAFATVNRWELGKCKPNFKAQKAFHAFCEKNQIKFDDQSAQ